ncbi:MAG: undecaprenyldiphospho-muramoylpentapeptide beta-N-acetylglucosaminyltransferase [Bacteroidales bacterium]|nr:undecaprenyldiphospho-muramoylpentapeptide beta-N-acetylglucosaminyltransferase [Bacteroidales bacterium]
MEKLNVIISGGGTGGHIFPAISIANGIKEINPNANILFVGATGRMEMERVPAAGYRIIGIPAQGLKRPLYHPYNIKVAFDYLRCRIKAKKIIKDFKPDIIVRVGGYASAAIVGAASKSGLPILLQEQNSFAGIVNRSNGKYADKICVAYDGMERFFPKEKIMITGNPIRKDITKSTPQMREEAYRFYNLDPKKKTIFVVGGSLGCRTLNDCMKAEISKGKLFSSDVEGSCQVIWQCGKIYKDEIDAFMREQKGVNVFHTHFIQRMDLAYAAADIVISRAGAGTISELCVAGKCTIFVPSPNVAEDHQTHNAMALVNKYAALMVKDGNAREELFGCVTNLLKNPAKIQEMERNIVTLGRKDAAQVIAKECIILSGIKK